MTDRAIVYDAALPQATDLLNTSKFAMLGDAFLAMAALGNSATAPSTVVAGLACTPTSPASLQVNVGPGAIFSLDAVDATGYGDLGTDSNQVYKMGIREALATLPAITPPSTSGFSQVFLVQAILSDVDAGSTVLSYYNASNPAVPFSGPNNSGTSQYTTRTCVCTIALKAGVAAATGSQTQPAPDTGYTALYYITVANGQTQITAGNIQAANSGYAPFVNTALPYIPVTAQSGIWTYFQDTGSANNVVVKLAPIPTALNAGMELNVKMAFAPTGASVFNCGFGNNSIVTPGSTPIVANAWNAGDIVKMVFDGTYWQARGVVQAGQPVYLQSARTYYVGGTGASDSNDGLSATVSGGHGPWATLSHAAAAIAQFNLNGYNVTINVANGTYAGVSLPAMSGSGAVNWVGNTSSPASCIISGSNQSAVIATGAGGTHTFTGFEVTASGSSSTDAICGFNVAGSMNVQLGVIVYGTCVGAQIAVTQNGLVSNLSASVGWTISGGCAGNASIPGCFLYASGGGKFQNNAAGGPSINISVAVTFAGSFVAAHLGSFTQLVYAALTGGGSVTGQRYNVDTNANITTGGGGANYYPGTIAGTASTTTYGSYT